ncbi:methyltransferase [Amycolatopsis cihanbeyliensis]|uniref:Methyltransferase family protein n=1 Tax=Amycolatopsis cihanbeyliensis TaxID=1128664 RepID=A0A542DBP5_AMYCI|nr:methyltransferase [Amycolatopsis cihanbeyliensis]TQJ00475.1 methyltransferase family protein [Amycolatopsis cihanbeyliensis]
MPVNLDAGDGPPSFLDMITTAGYRAATAGLRLGVFPALAEGPLPAAELAARIDADPRGTTLLADVLVSCGYLTADGDRYANAPMADKWLAGGDYRRVEHFWSTVLFDSWGELETSVRSGAAALDFYAWLAERPETLGRFQGMLSAHAEHIAPEVAALVPVGRTLLDVGGGHATYPIRLCSGNPSLHATVVDRPEALNAAAVEAAGVTDRITLRPGDYDELDLGSGFDTALLFNVVHGRTAAANRTLLHRVAAALRPGGAVVLLEHQEHPADPVDDAFTRVFSLNLFHGQCGQVYPAHDIAAWLLDAGFGEPEIHPLESSPAQSVLIARLGGTR